MNGVLVMDSLLPPSGSGSRPGAVQGRHVDKLDVLPDELLKKQDEAYLVRGWIWTCGLSCTYFLKSLCRH